MLEQLKEKVYDRGIIPLFNRYNDQFDRYSDMREHIIISGTTRGGTTWLTELLYQPHQCLIWEPLLYEHLAEHISLQFAQDLGAIPYIPEHEKWDAAYNMFSRLLRGRDQGFYTLMSHRSSNRNLFRSGSLLIKFCRANLLLPWLTANFDVKPVYLIRHPLAVIASQLNHPGYRDLGPVNNIFSFNQPRYRDIFEKYEPVIRRSESREAMFANWWAIQQVLALTHPERHKRWLTVSYEKLYLEPETELARIADWTGMKLPPDWKARINRPSQTTLGNVTEQSMRPELNTWKESLKRDQIKIILDIVHAYGINIYTDAAEPDYTNLYPLNAYEKKH